MTYRLTGLLFFILLFQGCSSDTSEKTIEQTQRKIISFKSYDQNYASKNSIFIQLADSCKSDLKHIKVRLTHGAGYTPMSNFLLTIYSDNNGYWLVMEDSRFLEKEFNSINDTIIEKDLYLDLYKFRSYTDSVFSYLDLKNRINSSKRIAILATMNDMVFLKDPLSSSSLRRSNMIEIIYE